MRALSLSLQKTWLQKLWPKRIAFGFFLAFAFLAHTPPAFAQFRERFFPPEPHMIPMPPQQAPQGYAPRYGARRYAPQPRVVFLPLDAIKHRLALQGFNVSRIWRRGEIYLAEGVDRRRMRVRIAAEPYEGSVLEVIALGAAAPMAEKRTDYANRAVEKPPIAKQKTARLQKMNDEDDEEEVVITPRAPRKVKPPTALKPDPKPQLMRSKTTRIEKSQSLKKEVVKRDVEKKSNVAKVTSDAQLPVQNNMLSTPKNTENSASTARNPPVKKISKLPSVAPVPNDLELSAPQPAISPVEEVKPAPKTSTKQGRG
jgi:hypothetical protein